MLRDARSRPTSGADAAIAADAGDAFRDSGSSPPTLDAIAADPATAASLSAHLAETLIGRALGALNALYARLLAARCQSPKELGPERLWTADEAADFLQVPVSWVYESAKSGRLPSIRLGPRYVRFSRTALEKALESPGRVLYTNGRDYTNGTCNPTNSARSARHSSSRKRGSRKPSASPPTPSLAGNGESEGSAAPSLC